MEIKANELRYFLNNYCVSQDGQIFSKLSNKFLKQDMSSLYNAVVLSNNSVKKKFSVHRVVAMVYIENPLNKPCVNHINGIKHDNRVENLEWCTYSENERHSFDILGKKIAHSSITKQKLSEKAKGRDMSIQIALSVLKRKGLPAQNRKKVILNNEVVYSSITEASLMTGLSIATISNSINFIRTKTKLGVWTRC